MNNISLNRRKSKRIDSESKNKQRKKWKRIETHSLSPKTKPKQSYRRKSKRIETDNKNKLNRRKSKWIDDKNGSNNNGNVNDINTNVRRKSRRINENENRRKSKRIDTGNDSKNSKENRRYDL